MKTEGQKQVSIYKNLEYTDCFYKRCPGVLHEMFNSIPQLTDISVVNRNSCFFTEESSSIFVTRIQTK